MLEPSRMIFCTTILLGLGVLVTLGVLVALGVLYGLRLHLGIIWALLVLVDILHHVKTLVEV